MRRLSQSEYSTRAYDPLPREEAEALAGTERIVVTADLAGRTLLTSTSYVGVVRVREVELRVTPKVGIRRLLWLVGYGADPTGWRYDEDTVELVDVGDLVAAMAVSFVQATERALHRGLLRSYRVMEEALPVLRGRLRETDQLRNRMGLAVPLEVRFDDYTPDIPENRVLLSAALRLTRLPDVPPRTLGAIHRLIALLGGDVSPLVPGDELPQTCVEHRNRHYQPALRLARLILTGRSLEQPIGSVLATGFFFDLNKVFEDWLGSALGQALRGREGRLQAQWRGTLDVGHKVRIRPDLVWEVGRRPVAVLDAKYKLLQDSTQPNADLYQMLAYCTALGLKRGHLVYAAGAGAATEHVVRQTGTTLLAWPMHLDKPIPELMAEVRELAEAIALGNSPPL